MVVPPCLVKCLLPASDLPQACLQVVPRLDSDLRLVLQWASVPLLVVLVVLHLASVLVCLHKVSHRLVVVARLRQECSTDHHLNNSQQ